MVSKFNRWIPMERPITKAIKTIHLSAPGSSAWASHFNLAQKTTAVHKDDRANTIVSTAENQKVSVKVKVNAPTRPPAMIMISLPESGVSSRATSIFLANAVMVQNRNIMVPPLAIAEPILVKNGTLVLSPKENSEKNLPSMANIG